MARTSPTQRTLAVLRKEGGLVAVVEKWNPYARIRQDAFGFIDLIALTGTEIIAIQCTSDGNHAARRTKLLTETPEPVRAWLLGGGRVQVRSWGKRGPRGKRKLWTERVEEITLADLEDAYPSSPASSDS